MQPRYDITETIVALYTIQGLTASKEPTKSLTDKLWLIADPSGSICVIGAANASEWLYKIGSDYFTINEKLRDLILPHDRLAPSLHGLKTNLRQFSHFLPSAIRPALPLHILCDDAAMLASRAQSTLKTGAKVKACITLTGEIAKETILREAGKQLQSGLQMGMEQATHAAIDSTINPTTPPKPVMQPAKTGNSWSDALFGVAQQAANTDFGKNWIGAAKSQLNSKFVETVTAATANAYQTGDITSAVKVTAKAAATHTADKISAKATNLAIAQSNQRIDACVDDLNKQLDDKEREYLTQVSSIIVDHAAKQAMTFCLSTGAGAVTAAYLIPNITKWGLTFFMGDAAAEMVTMGVKVLAVGFTGKAAYTMICRYDATRQENNERLAMPLREIETQVTEGLTNQMKTLLPHAGSQASLFGEKDFVSRCAHELPVVFSNTGNAPGNK